MIKIVLTGTQCITEAVLGKGQLILNEPVVANQAFVQLVEPGVHHRDLELLQGNGEELEDLGDRVVRYQVDESPVLSAGILSRAVGRSQDASQNQYSLHHQFVMGCALPIPNTYNLQVATRHWSYLRVLKSGLNVLIDLQQLFKSLMNFN